MSAARRVQDWVDRLAREAPPHVATRFAGVPRLETLTEARRVASLFPGPMEALCRHCLLLLAAQTCRKAGTLSYSDMGKLDTFHKPCAWVKSNAPESLIKDWGHVLAALQARDLRDKFAHDKLFKDADGRGGSDRVLALLALLEPLAELAITTPVFSVAECIGRNGPKARLNLIRWAGTGTGRSESLTVEFADGNRAVAGLVYARTGPDTYVCLSPWILTGRKESDDGGSLNLLSSMWLWDGPHADGRVYTPRDRLSLRVEAEAVLHPQTSAGLEEARFPHEPPFIAHPINPLDNRLPAGWRIEKTIGQGSSGRVYLAQTSDGASRAVKHLERRSRLSSGRRDLFDRLSSLSSSGRAGVVRYRTDESQLDRSPVLVVMDYVDGRCLDVALSDVDAPQRLAIARALLQSVAALHDGGIAHRDIHPGNILVRHEDNQPVLIDFAFAKDDRDPAGRGTALTSLRARGWGVEPFAPKEQLAGELPPRDALRADVHALGWAVVTLLSDRNDLPVDLDHALRTCPAWVSQLRNWMSADPEERPADAGEALAAFERARTADDLRAGDHVCGVWVALREAPGVGWWVGARDGRVALLIEPPVPRVMTAWAGAEIPFCARVIARTAEHIIVSAPKGEVMPVHGAPLGPRSVARYVLGLRDVVASMRPSLHLRKEDTYLDPNTGTPWVLRPGPRPTAPPLPTILDHESVEVTDVAVDAREAQYDLTPVLGRAIQALEFGHLDDEVFSLLPALVQARGPHVVWEYSDQIPLNDAPQRQLDNALRDVNNQIGNLESQYEQLERERRTDQTLRQQGDIDERITDLKSKRDDILEELRPESDTSRQDSGDAAPSGRTSWRYHPGKASIDDASACEDGQALPCEHVQALINLPAELLVRLAQSVANASQPSKKHGKERERHLDARQATAVWTANVAARSLIWLHVSTTAARTGLPSSDFEDFWHDYCFTRRALALRGLPSFFRKYRHDEGFARWLEEAPVSFWGVAQLKAVLGLLKARRDEHPTDTELKNRAYFPAGGGWFHGLVPFEPTWLFGAPPFVPIYSQPSRAKRVCVRVQDSDRNPRSSQPVSIAFGAQSREPVPTDETGTARFGVGSYTGVIHIYLGGQLTGSVECAHGRALTIVRLGPT